MESECIILSDFEQHWSNINAETALLLKTADTSKVVKTTTSEDEKAEKLRSSKITSSSNPNIIVETYGSLSAIREKQM